MPGCGASGVGRSPTPDCPPSGRAAGANYPLAVGAGGCGGGDPSPALPRALLGAGFARCGGSMRVPGGGASCRGVGRPGSGTLPPPTARPLGGLPGPTTHRLGVRGVAGVGTRYQPHSARSCELALRAVGAAQGRPGGGASCLGVGHPGSSALPSPTAGPLGGLPGPTTHWLWVPGGEAVGTRHQPHSARSFELALRAVGAAPGRPGGGASCLGVGRPGSGALPPPTARPVGGLPGPTTHWLWVRGSAGLGTRHQPHSARSFELALRAVGAAGGRPGRGASCVGVGRPGSGALPPQTARPLGGLLGPTTHWMWMRGGAGVGIRHQPHSARSLELAFHAVGAARGRPGGGASCLDVGRPGSGALPSPTARPLGGLPGPTTHWLWVRGVRAWGPLTNPTARALASWLCALWGRHQGARGGRLLPGCGASGVGRSPTPDCPPFRRAAGLLCLCVPCLAGSGGPASRARFGAPHLSFRLSCFALCLFGPLRAGVALFVVVVGGFFLFLFPFSPSLRPRCVLLCVFSGPGCLGPWRLEYDKKTPRIGASGVTERIR